MWSRRLSRRFSSFDFLFLWSCLCSFTPLMEVIHAITYFSKSSEEGPLCGCEVFGHHDNSNGRARKFGSQVKSLQTKGLWQNFSTSFFQTDGWECQRLCLLPIQHESKHSPGRVSTIFLMFHLYGLVFAWSCWQSVYCHRVSAPLTAKECLFTLLGHSGLTRFLINPDNPSLNFHNKASKGSTAAEYQANLKKVYTVSTAQVGNIPYYWTSIWSQYL